MSMIAKSACDTCSINAISGRVRGPSASSASPKRTENSSTCSTSPRANASTTVVGMMFIRKSVVVSFCDAVA